MQKSDPANQCKAERVDLCTKEVLPTCESPSTIALTSALRGRSSFRILYMEYQNATGKRSRGILSCRLA